MATGDFDDLLDGTNTFSISLWFKPSDLNNAGNLWSNVNSGGGNDGVSLSNRGSTNPNRLRYYLIDNFGLGSYIRRDFIHTMVNDSWYHIVATYDGSEDISGLTVYQDATSLTVDGTNDVNGGFIGDIESNVNLTFGNSSGVLDGALPGKYSDITIWDIELSSAQVTTLYNSGKPGNPRVQINPTNLRMWLRIDEDNIFHPSCRDSEGEATASYINIPITDITTDVP